MYAKLDEKAALWHQVSVTSIRNERGYLCRVYPRDWIFFFGPLLISDAPTSANGKASLSLPRLSNFDPLLHMYSSTTHEKRWASGVKRAHFMHAETVRQTNCCQNMLQRSRNRGSHCILRRMNTSFMRLYRYFEICFSKELFPLRST